MTRTIEVHSDLEALLIDQAIAMARELERVSDAAPDGHVLAIAELAALRAGRELTRVALEATLNRQSTPAEKKGLLAEAAPAADRGRAKTQRRGKQ